MADASLRWVLATATLIAVPAIVAVVVLGVTTVEEKVGGRDIDCGEYSFDAADWRSEGEARLVQAESLERCRTLIGLTRTQVEAKLGGRFAKRRRGDGPSREWIYNVGTSGGLGTATLHVTFAGGRSVMAAGLRETYD